MTKQSKEEDGDKEFDEDEADIIKEENKSEYDLQNSLAELLGIIFKTHPELSGPLLQEFYNNIIPQTLQQG